MKRIHGEFMINHLSMEYSIAGEGEPVLVFHGGHSNSYEEFGYEELVGNGFSMITPSRAGYGNTSKEIGETLSLACDYYSKLLHHLHIEKVHVIAVSAGGPTGILFAKKFPHLTRSLTLQSAVTKEWLTQKDRTYKAAKLLFHSRTEKFTWGMISKMSRRFPHFMFKQMFSSFSTLPYKDTIGKISDDDISLFVQMNNRQRSRHGFLIDLSQTKEISSHDLQAIHCPSLIIHSRYDRSVSVEHAQSAHDNIPDSKLYVLDAWGHLIWLGSASSYASDLVIKFLKSNTPQNQ
ncbi:alpha/beta fold hydrolase [Halobacillus sp. Marseille-Q1614]|uniref:alpha/beta fold hydrolase n=1 Tax=Halobacillus sp. Marseille-Q1614 TaxID=2709134 RepID=UPI00156E12DA|nr:alpha/beta hydrolase [Halobacillus sp. Marseille-Q1614]